MKKKILMMALAITAGATSLVIAQSNIGKQAKKTATATKQATAKQAKGKSSTAATTRSAQEEEEIRAFEKAMMAQRDSAMKQNRELEKQMEAEQNARERR